MNTRARRGRPPTPAELQALSAAEDLGPVASLARVEATARMAFGAVAGAVGLLSVLGATTDASSRLVDDPVLLGLSWPLALLAASLLCAGLALVPALRAVDPASPTEIAAFYRSALLRRGALALASLALLAAGLTTSLAAVIDSSTEAPQLAASAVTLGSRLRVEATAIAHTSDGARLVLVVRAGRDGRVLCRATASSDKTATARCGPLTARAPTVTVAASLGEQTSSAVLQRGK